jgi:hypothetical protein
MNFLAGAALGAFIGLLIGLSTSPITAAVASGLVAILAAFFGLAKDAPTSAPDWLQRVIGFGLVGIVALLVGLHLRVTDSFAPSLAREVQELTAAGFDKPDALTVVRFRRFGLLPSGPVTGTPLPAGAGVKGTADTRSTVLFGASAQTCAELDPRRFANPDEALAAFTRRGGAWGALTPLATPLDGAARQRLVNVAWKLACEAS